MVKQFCKVNLVPKPVGEVPTIDVSQYDKELRTFIFVVYNGETLFEIPGGSIVTLRGTKPDNTGFEYECSYEGSVVSLVVKEQITVCAGRIGCELRIENNGILGTANVCIRVKRSALSSGIVISETELPMVEIASQSYYLLDEANQAIQDATQQAEALTEAIGQGLDYDNLTDKPSINGVTLSGNKTTQDLGISGGLIDAIKVNDVVQPIVNKTVNIANATTSLSGAMSSTDKTKLDGIESGSQVNTVNYVSLDPVGNNGGYMLSLTFNGGHTAYMFYDLNAIDGLFALAQQALSLKADRTELNSYALLNSPSFSGTPTVPNVTQGDSSTKIANTAFVATAISNTVGDIETLLASI